MSRGDGPCPGLQCLLTFVTIVGRVMKGAPGDRLAFPREGGVRLPAPLVKEPVWPRFPEDAQPLGTCLLRAPRAPCCLHWRHPRALCPVCGVGVCTRSWGGGVGESPLGQHW